MAHFGFVRVIVSALLLLPPVLCAQSEAPLRARSGTHHLAIDSDGADQSTTAIAPATTNDDALLRTFRAADTVFSGEVLSIDHTDAAVTVRWRVDDAVRGQFNGNVYTIREWPGLWADGASRYTVGERALVFLHSPSAAGFVSPVGDMQGVVPITGSQDDAQADLRWVAASLLRSTATSRTGADSQGNGDNAVRSATVSAAAIEASSQSADSLPTPQRQPDQTRLSDLLGVLKGWTSNEATEYQR